MTQAPVELETDEPMSHQLHSQMLRDFVGGHASARHPLFAQLDTATLSQAQAGRLLRNYDAHASHLRRLLLKAATIMPECAVGYILENVRNEYGNGRAEDRHQLQLQDLAWQIGITRAEYNLFPIEQGIKTFIKDVTAFYYPLGHFQSDGLTSRAAVAAGAITATELLAVEEFKSLQKTFTHFGLRDHIWFDHVTIECEHLEDSVNLALYFLQGENLEAYKHDVLFGLKGVLDANIHLYDGLINCTL